MEDSNKDVKSGEQTPTDGSTDKKDSEVKEDVKIPEDPDKKVDELLNQDKRILVDKDRFNDRNDKAKLYETFAPIIEKVKDNPDLVEKLLETKEKGSLESRLSQIEEERKEAKRRELRTAVSEALNRWPGFDKDWNEIRDSVDMLSKRGVGVADAIRRSYLALHPELAEQESQRIAKENANALGTFVPSRGGRSPQVISDDKKVVLNEREEKVFQDLIGKDYGGGFVPIKSKEDYARLMEKHKDHLRARGFYDLP